MKKGEKWKTTIFHMIFLDIFLSLTMNEVQFDKIVFPEKK